jgi:hypothetical protein
MEKTKKDNDLVPWLISITEYMENNGLKVRPAPKVILSKDKSFVNDVFGKTAWYEPTNKSITLITEGRHPKDILRSYAHELVHHSQNLRGDMQESNVDDLKDPNYTQNNKHLRKLEAEAYLSGNLNFRDWEDKQKNKK